MSLLKNHLPTFDFRFSTFNFINLPTLICIDTHTTRVPVTSRSKWYVHGTLGLGNFHFYSNCLVGNKRRLIHARRRLPAPLPSPHCRHHVAAVALPPPQCHRLCRRKTAAATTTAQVANVQCCQAKGWNERQFVQRKPFFGPGDAV